MGANWKLLGRKRLVWLWALAARFGRSHSVTNGIQH